MQEKNPDRKYKLYKAFNLKGIGGFNNIKLLIYRNDSISIADERLCAFLYDGINIYYICGWNNLGYRYVKVLERDVTYDKKNELIIQFFSGHPFSTIVGYDKQKKKWEIILDAGGIDFVDFDGTGNEMLVTRGLGSIAPLVDIHIWEKDHFETLACERELSFIRADIRKDGKEVYIVEDTFPVGKIPGCFQFINGSLIEVKNPFKY